MPTSLLNRGKMSSADDSDKKVEDRMASKEQGCLYEGEGTRVDSGISKGHLLQ